MKRGGRRHGERDIATFIIRLEPGASLQFPTAEKIIHAN